MAFFSGKPAQPPSCQSKAPPRYLPSRRQSGHHRSATALPAFMPCQTQQQREEATYHLFRMRSSPNVVKENSPDLQSTTAVNDSESAYQCTHFESRCTSSLIGFPSTWQSLSEGSKCGWPSPSCPWRTSRYLSHAHLNHSPSSWFPSH
eukprot:767284-Hanusia_phi.AAC.4